MLLIQNILAFLSVAYRNAQLEAQRIYARLTLIVFGVMLVMPVMWFLNITGYQEFNIFIFFVGAFLITGFGFAPRPYVYGLLAGLGFYGLQDKDLSQGAAQGLKWAFNVTIGILFGFCLMAGLLATWSFKHDPAAFWYIAAMATVIVLAVNLFLKNSDKWFAKIVIAYAIIVIVIAAWGTVAPDTKQSVASIFTKVSEEEKVEGPIKFGDNDNTLIRKFHTADRTVFTPSGYCVGYEHADKFKLVEATQTYITLKPLVPVATIFTKYHQSTPRCKGGG